MVRHGRLIVNAHQSCGANRVTHVPPARHQYEGRITYFQGSRNLLPVSLCRTLIVRHLHPRWHMRAHLSVAVTATPPGGPLSVRARSRSVHRDRRVLVRLPSMPSPHAITLPPRPIVTICDRHSFRVRSENSMVTRAVTSTLASICASFGCTYGAAAFAASSLSIGPLRLSRITFSR